MSQDSYWLCEQANFITEDCKHSQVLFEAFQRYCWWIPNVWQPACGDLKIRENIEQPALLKSNDTPVAFDRKIRKRRRRSAVVEVDRAIQKVREFIDNEVITTIHGRAKLKPLPTGGNRDRSSRFIGVSRNGENWQVLINCGKYKKYIGTFQREAEAAIAYDFYSICLHTFKAKTNFTYTAETVLTMLEYYDKETKAFNSAGFSTLMEEN